MARTDTLTNFLTDVAAAIKAKKGDDTAIPAANFDTEILNLASGGGDDSTLKGLIERNLTSITIPNSVTSIGSSAFSGCTGLTSITIPDSVTSIGSSAFEYCIDLKSITIPDSVTSIGSDVFSHCVNLKSVMIGNSVPKITYGAFSSCNNLTNITISNSVTSIESLAFYNCTGLAEIDFSSHTSVPTLSNKDAFLHTSASLVIKVPSALLDEWKATTNWSTYADQIVGV